MNPEITSPAANVELVRAGFQAFNAGDADGCMSRIAGGLIAEGWICSDMATLFGQLR